MSTAYTTDNEYSDYYNVHGLHTSDGDDWMGRTLDPPKFGVANLAIDADLPSLPSYRLLTWGERDGCPEARTILTNDARPR